MDSLFRGILASKLALVEQVWGSIPIQHQQVYAWEALMILVDQNEAPQWILCPSRN